MQFSTSLRAAAIVAASAAMLSSYSFGQAAPANAPPAQRPPAASTQSAPNQTGPTQATPGQAAPSLSGPAKAPAPLTFPKPNPINFTTDSPSMDTVNAFLKASWGFDPKRVWQVEAILKTPVAGLSKVIVAVGEQGSPQQPGSLQFFVLPDGKHLIADDVLPFGAHPFDENRKLLMERATGPSRGSASKDMLFVEFSDFQCPHCKEAQATIDKLAVDYPNAHFVYQNYPLVQIHTEAYKAAAYSVCVDKAAGSPAFFKFVGEVFTNQAALTPEASEKTLKDAATKAGADPAATAACSTTPATKAAVDASMKLASDLGVNSTPTLYFNGRTLPLGGAYDQLKEVIAFQMTLDGLKQ